MKKFKLFVLAAVCISVCTKGIGQQVDAGNGHAIILDKKGDIYTVGRNNFGQLGDSTFTNSANPIKLESLPGIMTFSRGYDHSLAIDSNGTLYTWGRNNYGQLGTALNLDYNFPQELPGHKFIAVEGGHWHTVGLKADGTVWTWGHNFYGELGNGGREHSQYPTKVVKDNGNPLSRIVKIVSVGYHTLAIDAKGDVYSWGSNDFGELGHFDSSIQPFAKRISGLSNIESVAVGWHHSVALNKAGEIFVWGSDPSSQHKESTAKYFKEITKITGVPKMKKIACGSWHSLSLDVNDEVWGWGKNHFGMLGTGDTTSFSNPKKLNLPKGICEIGGGCFQSLAVDKEGNIYTMGDNPSGQQGQGHYGRLLNPEVLSLDVEPVVATMEVEPQEDLAETTEVVQEVAAVDETKPISYWLLKVAKYLLFVASILANVYLWNRNKKLKLSTSAK